MTHWALIVKDKYGNTNCSTYWLTVRKWNVGSNAFCKIDVIDVLLAVIYW